MPPSRALMCVAWYVWPDMREMRRWFVNCSGWVPSQADWCAAMASIQAEERERISKFMFQKDAKMALVGRLLLRAAVVRNERIPNDVIVFGRSERGKPMLLQPQSSELYVNVSHQGHHAVIAIERGREVGVDIMQFTRPRGQSTAEFFCIMRRQFTVGEWSHILAPPTSKQLQTFYRFWCLKESFIKGEGSGLSYGLQRLNFIPCLNWPPQDGTCCVGSVLETDGEKSYHWQFEESLIDMEHCVCVAVRRDHDYCCTEAPPTFSEVKLEDLLSWVTPLTSTDHTHWTHFISRKP